MGSDSVYDQIYKDNVQKISRGVVGIDPYLADHRVDTRRGISLIIPIQGIRKEYEALVAQFRAIAPEQHYYPFDDLHVTVFDFVQASEGYTRDMEHENEFKRITSKVLAGITRFPLDLRGPVFSSAAGLLAGYDDDILIIIRENIRRLMKLQGLKNDERYESRSAHVTFCKFCSRLPDPAGFVRLIAACKDLSLGTEQVARMELVEHDWYNSQTSKRVLATFALGSGG